MKLNGELMSRDIVIAEIENGNLKVINEELLPLYLRRNENMEGWLENRAIDRHRTNARLLKKVLRLSDYDDVSVALKVHAATITDTYWFRSSEEKSLTYQDVMFKDNIFDKLALYGNPDSFNFGYRCTPELTNIGSYEKCWRKIDGHWWLYKQGTDLERFSEMFICELGKTLGFSMAEYELDDKYIRSRDFTDGASVNFEAADSLVGENEDYILNFDVFDRLSDKVARQYVALIYMDALCHGMDRHTKNYGILRGVQSGEILSLAPNFDNNIALLSRGYPKNKERKNDKLIESFLELLDKRPKAIQYFKELNHPKIHDKIILSCCEKIPIEINREFLTNFILNGNSQILSKIIAT
jgi:hypothetical protein